MTAQRLQHVSIPVPSDQLETCIRFYVDVFGMQHIPNLAGAAWLRFGDDDHVHLLIGEPLSGTSAHLALQVDDLDETLERARANGATEVRDAPHLWGHPRWFLRDPVGNLIELFDTSPPGPDAITAIANAR